MERNAVQRRENNALLGLLLNQDSKSQNVFTTELPLKNQKQKFKKKISSEKDMALLTR